MQFKKSLGQHFLIDNNIKNKIVNLLQIENDESVLEIGPGDGALTEIIYKKCKNLILVEKDNRFTGLLKSKFPDIHIFNEDFLKWDFKNFYNLKVVGNLPYNVASQIIFKLIENIERWKIGVFMVQKEVADRIVASHGSKDYSILSVVCQTFFNVLKAFDVSPYCFKPKPKVVSSVIKFQPKSIEISDFNKFFNLTKAIFYGRRKKLINVLKKNPFLKFNDEFINHVILMYDENIRVEQLKVKDFVDLYSYWAYDNVKHY